MNISAEEDRVIELTEKDFYKGKVLDSKGNVKGKWFIKFYAPWCPHCQKLAPEWSQMSMNISEDISIGSLDCTKFDDVCTFYNVYSYPSIFYIDDSLGMVKYDGKRKEEQMIEYLNNEEYNNADSSKIKDIEKFRELSGMEKFKSLFGLT